MMTSNIPRQPTSFIGREIEVNEIVSWLTDPACRLLTLIGPGGIGKTRLAIEVGEKCTTAFADGIYFIHLQPIQSADLIIPTIADAIGLAFDEFRDQHVQLLIEKPEQRRIIGVCQENEHQ
jgi:predicted ATPase